MSEISFYRLTVDNPIAAESEKQHIIDTYWELFNARNVPSAKPPVRDPLRDHSPVRNPLRGSSPKLGQSISEKSRDGSWLKELSDFFKGYTFDLWLETHDGYGTQLVRLSYRDGKFAGNEIREFHRFSVLTTLPGEITHWFTESRFWQLELHEQIEDTLDSDDETANDDGDDCTVYKPGQCAECDQDEYVLDLRRNIQLTRNTIVDDFDKNRSALITKTYTVSEMGLIINIENKFDFWRIITPGPHPVRTSLVYLRGPKEIINEIIVTEQGIYIDWIGLIAIDDLQDDEALDHCKNIELTRNIIMRDEKLRDGSLLTTTYSIDENGSIVNIESKLDYWKIATLGLGMIWRPSIYLRGPKEIIQEIIPSNFYYYPFDRIGLITTDKTDDDFEDDPQDDEDEDYPVLRF